MLRTWLALLCCLLPTACGSKRSAQSAAEDLFTEVCAHVRGCCSPGEADFYLGPYTDDETCVERLVEAGRRAGGVTLAAGPHLPAPLSIPNLEALDDAISRDRLGIDGAALDACLQWLRELPCNTAGAPDPDACAPPEEVETPCRIELIFRGQVSSGGGCSSPGTTLECKEGLACHAFDSLGTLGVCGTIGEIDDFCFIDGECRQGLYCQQLDGTCQTPRQVGEDCRYADPDDPSPPASTLLVECAPGLSCDPLTDVCVAPCQQGATCVADDDCDEAQGLLCILSRCDVPRALGLPCSTDAHCEAGYRCENNPTDPSTRVCLPLIADGQPCPFGGHNECGSGFCHPIGGVCLPQVAPPGLCASGLDFQCLDSWCDTTFVSCAISSECPTSMTCNTLEGRCEYSCLALLADGAACLRSTQCASGACVDDVCRTLPVPDGGACAANFECASGFCNYEAPRVCEQLPLADGRTCAAGDQCASGVCFDLMCGPGLSEGESCDDPLGPPCGPDLYCDDEAAPVCQSVRDTGGTCEADYQCRGDCTIAWSRPMCDPTPAVGTAICDGN